MRFRKLHSKIKICAFVVRESSIEENIEVILVVAARKTVQCFSVASDHIPQSIKILILLILCGAESDKIALSDACVSALDGLWAGLSCLKPIN